MLRKDPWKEMITMVNQNFLWIKVSDRGKEEICAIQVVLEWSCESGGDLGDSPVVNRF